MRLQCRHQVRDRGGGRLRRIRNRLQLAGGVDGPGDDSTEGRDRGPGLTAAKHLLPSNHVAGRARC